MVWKKKVQKLFDFLEGAYWLFYVQAFFLMFFNIDQVSKPVLALFAALFFFVNGENFYFKDDLYDLETRVEKLEKRDD